VAGEHDHGLVHAFAHQRLQHRQPADARHAHVEHDRADVAAREFAQELLRVTPALHAQPHRGDQQGEAAAHRVVVVDQVDQGGERRIHGHIFPCCAGVVMPPPQAAGAG
jgi:hypothetical protein